MEINAGTLWLFPENLEAKGNLMEFVEATKYTTKSGVSSGQVFVLLGETQDAQGEFQIFPSKVKNLKELIKKLGKDDSKWKGVKFNAKPSGNCVLLEPI